MESPFVFDIPVTGKNHIGRRAEADALVAILSRHGNAVIYEPAKTGKTSLIRCALFNMKLKGAAALSVEVPLVGVRSFADLALAVAEGVMRASASTPDEFESLAERYLQSSSLRFDSASYARGGRLLTVSPEADARDVMAAISLPYCIAEQTGKDTVVVLKESQNILFAGEDAARYVADAIKKATPEQRKLCCFVFSGSQVNAMKSIFEDGKWFKRLCERVKLSPLGIDDIVNHVVKGFLISGKVIDKAKVADIATLLRGNIWYMNHFASICDNLSRGYVMEPVIDCALNSLLSVHEPRFVSEMNDLTNFQVLFLKAIIDGCNRFSSAETIARYGFNSSANVKRLKEALCRKEIILFDDNDKPAIQDPLFEYWLRKRFFCLENIK